MNEVLAVAWVIIIGFCILMYVLLDGFDLGIGMLFPLFSDVKDRNLMISTILPVWDGNQTWLVLGIASFYGAFPYAFSLLLPALYLPMFVMVIALLFRGITFEFRLKAKTSLPKWDFLFFLSSAVVTFVQGLILGSFVKGFELTNNELSFELFTPFNLTCAISLVFGYTLLAAGWIIAKTKGSLQRRMYNVARICLIVISLSLLIISLWSPFIHPYIKAIWFNPNYMYKLAFLPLITMLIIFLCWRSISKKKEFSIFWQAIGIFICSYVGFGISTFPFLVPHVISFFQAAAPASSLLFMLFGALLLLPILIGYTSYSYYIFRGKVTESISY